MVPSSQGVFSAVVSQTIYHYQSQACYALLGMLRIEQNHPILRGFQKKRDWWLLESEDNSDMLCTCLSKSSLVWTEAIHHFISVALMAVTLTYIRVKSFASLPGCLHMYVRWILVIMAVLAPSCLIPGNHLEQHKRVCCTWGKKHIYDRHLDFMVVITFAPCFIKRTLKEFLRNPVTIW